jgi:hypothetical protein
MRHLLHDKALAGIRLGRRARLAALVSVLVAPGALGGCATLPPDLVAGRELTLERVDSTFAHVGRVRVSAEGGALEVSGTLTRPFLQRGRIPGHLHIEAIGNDGALLFTTATSYHRRKAKTGRAQFSETLPVSPDQVRKVRVTHHGLSDKPC